MSFPRVINSFNAVLETKGHLDYLVYRGQIVVCNFSALDTLHQLGFSHKITDKALINKALFESSIAFARLSISSPDKLLFKIPLSAIMNDPRIRDDLLWLCASITKSLEVDIYVEFLRAFDRIKKVRCANTEFLRIAIHANS